MELYNIKPSLILDSDTEDEVIYFSETTTTGFYYTKNNYLSTDFNNQPITEKDDYIRTKSIWYADLCNNSVSEVLPSGHFDINAIYLAQNYLYILKIVDKDQDGLLNNDYENGEIWRVNRRTHIEEYCFDIGEHNFHGFELASDQFVVFKSEDRIPDVTEIVLVDLKNKRKSTIMNIYESENWFDYRIITDAVGNPTYLLGKRWVSEGEKGSTSNKLGCYSWSSVLDQLQWQSII